MNVPKNCKKCGTPFTTAYALTKYCSHNCRKSVEMENAKTYRLIKHQEGKNADYKAPQFGNFIENEK